ncbi:MAG: response regulator [Patescibacteria group bacterium]|nr:response regulator [Patescibacteria group bacterium]
MKKVLIIEDEDLIMDLLKKKLIQEGYEVSTAYDGEQGIEKLKNVKPDIVLLDIVMPKKSGYEVMEEMSKDPELSKIPIIVISNSGQPVELDKAKNLGAEDWLVKTEFDPKEVVEKVRRLIGG